MADAPIALIIGCGDMGMGCARALGRRNPLMLIDIDTARLDECVAALRHDGYSASGQSCDITDRAQLAHVGETLATTAGVKVLAHVAAIGNIGAGWRKVIEVDLIAAQLVAEAIGPHLVPGGAAIFISSTGAQRCPRDERLYTLLDDPLHPDLCDCLHKLVGRDPNFLEAYFMAKQGVNRLAERLAIKWGGRQVRAVSVSPGLIDSTMGRTGGQELPIYDGSGETRLGNRNEKARIEVPLRRQGSLLEVIAAVDFLASDAASFISGIDVPVDGGSSAYWRSCGDVTCSAEMEQLAPPAPPML